MLRKAPKVSSLRIGGPSIQPVHLPFILFRSSSRASSLPNNTLDLDPSYQQLLQDIDITLKKHSLDPVKPRRELEVLKGDSTSAIHEITSEDWVSMDSAPSKLFVEEDHDSGHRKSPATLFGSDQLGTVIIPLELQTAINLLIAEREKSEIRSDARRLFTSPGTDGSSEDDWDADYNKKYRSRTQAARHSTRDGTAFATVALPAHYSAITSVLLHLKQRLGSQLRIENVIDWGSGTGSGLWASLYAFQNETDTDKMTAVASTVKSYIALEKRDGLVAIGEKLVANTSVGDLNMKWAKSFKEEHKTPRENSDKTLALSAFMLTSLPTSIAQKTLIREMWNSGANTIVLIDHNTREGFEVIAYAREYILQLSKAELDDPDKASSDLLGSHVVAPCPHDRPCPLLHSGGAPIICGFSQRLQRPAFVRRTKHSGVGHEDIGYSYVVIRRGLRPDAVMTDIGRIGAIGKQVLRKEHDAAIPMKELKIHIEDATSVPVSSPDIEILTPKSAIAYAGDNLEQSELQEILRKEAYSWPRLVFPPLKRSGHIVLDSCTAEGKIMRLTIPKSQGKQAFYDARKSSWGDLFPHIPKIKPLERSQPKSRHRNKIFVGTGSDIGKRGKYKNEEGPSYANLSMTSPRPNRKLAKRTFQLTRGNKVWDDVD